MEARQDESQALPEAPSGLLWPEFNAPAVRTDPAGALAELAHAVDRDLGNSDHSAATQRAYAHDWADFSDF